MSSVGRTVGKPFPKGKSGNPGGRAKQMVELTALARENTAAAFAQIVKLAKSAKAESVRLAAAIAVCDRAFGKPITAIELATIAPIEVEHQHNVNVFPVDAATVIAQAFAKARGDVGLPARELSDDLTQEMRDILATGQPLPPSLYKALHAARAAKKDTLQ